MYAASNISGSNGRRGVEAAFAYTVPFGAVTMAAAYDIVMAVASYCVCWP